MQKRIILILTVFIVLSAILLLLWSAPPTSRFHIPGLSTNHVDCLRNETGDCFQIPSVTGIDLDSQPVSFPEAFTTETILIVMPFDRDQQVRAETWLPLFQELARDDDRLSYYSVAALPKLNAAVRVLVIGGMSAGLRDPVVRQQMAVLFLEDQEAFLAALEIETVDAIQVFIIDSDGTIFWRGAGDYTEATAQDLKTVLADLLE